MSPAAARPRPAAPAQPAPQEVGRALLHDLLPLAALALGETSGEVAASCLAAGVRGVRVRPEGGPLTAALARRFPGWSFAVVTGWVIASREGQCSLAVPATAAMLEFGRRFDAGEWPGLEAG